MKHVLIAVALCAHSVAACDMVTGNGVAKTEARDVANFSAIELAGSIEAQVAFGEAFTVTVSGDENLVPLVRTTVVGGALQISTQGSYRTKLPLRVSIVMPALSALEITGSGRAVVQNVRAKALKIQLSGSGHLEISGAADAVSLVISGSGDVSGRGFTAANADVAISGSGTVEIAATTRLVANISGSGSLRYRGPVNDVASTVTGSGSVTRLD
ncbi:MAG: DUF2807 domain-containing protein [Myxococcales bacterium]|nr:DUF2807 domain-containing protein [Myxococcales bacterium]